MVSQGSGDNEKCSKNSEWILHTSSYVSFFLLILIVKIMDYIIFSSV